MDSGGPTDATLPNADSSQCVMLGDHNGPPVCVYCSDDKWHCGTQIYSSCPGGVTPGDVCTESANCISCNASGGELLNCGPVGHHLIWTAAPVTCR
jgi:hypothetical protein